MRTLVIVCLASSVASSFGSPALAGWPKNPATNLAVSTAVNDQNGQQVVSDGAGGVIITWVDFRGVDADIYAQHVLGSGAVDPAWPANGRALCTAFGSQGGPQIASDGAGGAIVTWHDPRFDPADVYAQHVLASGVVDPAWPVDGRLIVALANYQGAAQIVSDGAGGAIVCWLDLRSGLAWDIYAHHVLASGVLDPAWPVNGRGVCTATQDQFNPKMTSDGAGGAIICWYDYRVFPSNIYAQHVLASGAVDPAWTVNGVALCLAAQDQSDTRIVSDDAGGAIVTWIDLRTGLDYDIYAQHVLAAGVVDPGWPADGRAVCTAGLDQWDVRIASDGAGGAILCWTDYRSGPSDIYAQHVLASGAVDPAWPVNGRGLCTAASTQLYPEIVSDGAGGAIVGWQDLRGGTWDIYAQRVLATGVVDPLWTAQGNAISTASFHQTFPHLLGDGAGAAILCWDDNRTGVAYDVYAQRIARYGYLGTPEAEIAGVDDVPNDQGGRVKVSWRASYLETDPYNLVTYYKVFRSVPPNLAASMLKAGARAVSLSDPEALSLDRPGDLFSTEISGATYFWEYLATVNADFIPTYSYVAPTTGDSTGDGNPLTAFMIQARTMSNQHWESLPVSGYSVDDLAPVAPAPFTGQFSAGTAYLHWDPNTEADLAGYRLYRGPDPSFVPGPGNLVASLADTGYADPAGSLYVYKLTAVDVHGNESPVATLTPAGTVAVEPGSAPGDVSFAPPSPNPAAVAVTLRYGLPRAASVRLAVYDAAGRLVRELARGERGAGEHAERWDLRDAGGRVVTAGLYFGRLEVGGRTLVRRLAVTP